MEKKYKLTKENIDFFGRTLYRIEALKDFDKVKKGDKGGYVQSEDNLSQEGDCWIYNNAQVFGNAKVFNDAKVFDNVKVFNDAQVYDNAYVYGDAIVTNSAKVYGDAKVYDNAQVFGNARVCHNAKVYDTALVCGNARVCHNAQVFGNAIVCKNAEIKDKSDYIVFKNWWSSGRYFTWTKSNNMWKVGCFYGTGNELIAKAYEDSEISGREYEKVVKYVESIIKQ